MNGTHEKEKDEASPAPSSLEKADEIHTGHDRPYHYDPPPLWRHLFGRLSAPPLPKYSIDEAPIIPLSYANPISKALFTWIYPIVSLGARRSLVAEDLWALSERQDATPLSEKFTAAFERRRAFSDEWNARVDNGWTPSFHQRLGARFDLLGGYNSKTHKRVPTVVGALSDTFGRRFWYSGAFKVVADVLQVTEPLVTKELIKYATNAYLASRGAPGYSDPGVGKGIGIVFGLLAMEVVGFMCTHQYMARAMSVGVLARGALISSLYDRGMKLSNKSRLKINTGKLINHISTDVSRIDQCAQLFHMGWTAALQLCIIIAILCVNLGVSALSGVGFAILAAPVQLACMFIMFSLRARSMEFADKRVKLMQELLGGIKVLKFFAWEIPYINKVKKIRASELKCIRGYLLVVGSLNGFVISIPVICSILAFLTYSLRGNSQNAAVIFTSLSLFNLLSLPLIMLPITLGAIADSKNACDRLQSVFLADTAEDVIESRRSDIDVAVRVNKAEFKWDALSPEELEQQKREEEEEKKKAMTPAEKKEVAKKEKEEKEKARVEAKARRNVSTPKRSLLPSFISRRHAKEAAASGMAAEANHTTLGGPIPPTAEGETPTDLLPTATAGSSTPAKSAGTASSSGRASLEHDVSQLRDIDIEIPRGQLCAIVGPVGSGKSSLLQAILGQMKKVSGDVQLGGTVSYASQTAWIQNATLRDNILFGQPFEEERYWQVLKDACLEPDLKLLPNGDMSEIGEKGINLSGGQRQRVNIARTIYYDADIMCFDDPLSAVDAHVGEDLFDTISNKLPDKTRILVTHALHFVSRCDYIYCVDNGRITERGTYEQLMQRDGAFSKLLRKYGQDTEAGGHKAKVAPGSEKGNDEKDAKLDEKALMQEEEKAEGSVGAKAYYTYLKAAHLWITGPMLILFLCAAQGASVLAGYTLVWWGENKFSQSNGFYIGLYAGLGVASALLTFGMGGVNAFIGFFSSVNLHKNAVYSVFHAPMSMFDTTPLGRIMNRFSKDMDSIDNELNSTLSSALIMGGNILGQIVLIGVVQPYFLIAAVALLALVNMFGSFYRHSARDIKRLDNLLRSKLYAHFSESLNGMATIKASGETPRFVKDNRALVNLENRAYLLTIYNQSWLGLRLDICGTILVFVVGIIVVVTRTSQNPSQTGLILSYVVGVSQALSWFVHQVAEAENNMNSVERLQYYADDLEQEAPATLPDHTPPSHWPQQGCVNFNDVEMSYRPNLPPVLRNLSLSVKAGEKVGIVGRTGSGKSSLMMSLLRIVEVQKGTIVVDGIDISKIGLADLRNNIAIIPQEALLFNGTIRTNLDPFGVYEDVRLWDALRRAWLVQPEGAESAGEGKKRFTLDTVIEDEGGNLSVGERSLVSLARALVKDSRIIVLDEATASVDVETDAKIQRTIREEFRDKTLLCIAHRLRTIISYDRVLVMDKGQVAEFDTAEELFKAEGIFHGMCVQSNIGLEDIRRQKQQEAREGAE